MTNSVEKQVLEGERIYRKACTNDEEKISRLQRRSLATDEVKPQITEIIVNRHLTITQRILDLLDEKLQSPVAKIQDKNNNHHCNTSALQIGLNGSNKKLKVTPKYHFTCLARVLQDLDYYSDHVIKDSTCCHSNPPFTQEQINHQSHKDNSCRYDICNACQSESSIALTLDKTSGSSEAQLTCDDDSEALSVSSLTSFSWEACCCKLGESLIIDGVSCEEVKYYRRGNRSVEQDCIDEHCESNSLNRQESTSNNLETICPVGSLPESHFHNPVATYCYESSLEPVAEQCAAKLIVHDRFNRDKTTEVDKENKDEEKYLHTLHAKVEFASEVGGALEKFVCSKCWPALISANSESCSAYSTNPSFVSQHCSHLSSLEKDKSQDYCSDELESAKSSSSWPNEKTHSSLRLCLCAKCTNSKANLIGLENGCDYPPEEQGKISHSTSTNYKLLSDLAARRISTYDSGENKNSLRDLDTSVRDTDRSYIGCLYRSLSLDNLSENDVSISLCDLSPSRNDGRSMRAVKEIVKTSIPSISSLQNLPSLFESTKLKRTTSTGTTMESSSKNNKRTCETHSVDMSQESLPNESHILGRLCLCNCIMKNSNMDDSDESLKNRVNSQCKSSHIKSKSNCFSSSSNSLKNTSNKQTSVTSREDISLLRSTEKQSPAFLNILLKSAVELKNGPLSLKHRTLSPSSQHQASIDDISSVLSGTSDELYSSSSSLSGGLKRRQLKSHSSLLLSEQRASQTLASASSEKRQDLNIRPSSECSNVEPSQRCASTLRYLSLSKLFNNNRSFKASGECKDDKKISKPINTSGQKLPENCDQKHKSFLTKSLQRLSYKKKHNKSSKANQTSSTGSNSPAPSNSEYSTDAEQRFNSLPIDPGPIKSAQSQLLSAPEISINHVEYCNAQDSTKIRLKRTTDSMDLSSADTESVGQIQSDLYDCNESTKGGLLVSDTDEGSFSFSSTPNFLHDYYSSSGVHPKRSPRLSRSPVPFDSPATQSSRIEDGIRVCSVEHFEKHIDNIKDTQIEAQKKLFKLWINHYCPNLIRSDLVLELKDGIKLIGLVASLTRDKQLLSTYGRLNRDRQTYINRIVTTPSSRLRHLSNVSIAIDFLREKVGMKLINLNPMDIVSGKPNVILGLCWNIILNFQLEQNFPRCDCSEDQTSVAETGKNMSSSNVSIRKRSNQETLYCFEEYSSSYFLNAKKKVLDHINERFNLKLTTLTSNLINGDVLLTIIKQLSPEVGCMQVIRGQGGQIWDNMSNDDKLDCCFALAQAHLNIPCLFSASDLMRHKLDHNNFKPLLVYLSMLLSVRPTTVGSQTQNEQLNVGSESDIDSSIRSYLNDVDTTDKFYLAKLHSTTAILEKVGNIIQAQAEKDDEPQLDQNLIDRYTKLRDQINRIESLISWINEADNLIETTNILPEDLKDSIDKYKDFFSESRIPTITNQICPILRRQYRECLSNARQKILSMEQTCKNWNSYETTSDKLKQWLASAELKLCEASKSSQAIYEAPAPVEHLTNLMQEIIDYFELESIDNIMSEELVSGNLDLMMNEDTISLTGSIASINSNSSRALAFKGSPKAKSTQLFEEFEMKTHLLATVLEPSQRENILLALKQFKHTLKLITKIQVPKVVNELRWSIIQLDSELNQREELDAAAVVVEDELIKQDVERKLSLKPCDMEVTSDIKSTIDSLECSEDLVVCKEVNRKGRALKNESKSKRVKRQSNSKNLKHKLEVKEEVKKERPWSLSSLLFGNKEPGLECQTKARQTNCITGQAKDTKIDNRKFPSYTQLYWSKLVRAYKTSLPLTIVLLICLAGVCVVPLINQNICCDFKLDYIPPENVDIGEKPT